MSIIKNITLPDGNVYAVGVFTGTCDTTSTIATKSVLCDKFTTADLKIGAIVYVTFTYTNSYSSVANLKMNVNSTGDKPIKKFYNASISNLTNYGELRENETYMFQYDGTNWVCMTSEYNSDTKNQVGSSNSNEKLYLVGATTQTGAATATQSYSNSNVYIEDGSLYAKALYQGTSEVATKSYVDSLVANATVYKGTFNALNGKINGGSTTLTSVAEKIGHLYKCDTAGTYAGIEYEVGDSIYFVKNVSAGTAPVGTDINPIEGTVAVSVPPTTPELSDAETTIATVEGVNIKAKIASDYIKRADLNSSINALNNKFVTSEALNGYLKPTDLPGNYSKIDVYPTSNSTTATQLAPSSSTATVSFKAGNNVTINADSQNNSITFSATDTKYTAGTNISISSDNVISAGDTLSKIQVTSADGGTVPPNNFDSSITPIGGILGFVAGTDISIGLTNSNQIKFQCTYQGVKGVGISTIQAISADAYNDTAFIPDPSTVYIVTAN